LRAKSSANLRELLNFESENVTTAKASSSETTTDKSEAANVSREKAASNVPEIVEYLPSFSESHKKQLDEQLRNVKTAKLFNYSELFRIYLFFFFLQLN
jgi:hypothetical protein